MGRAERCVHDHGGGFADQLVLLVACKKQVLLLTKAWERFGRDLGCSAGLHGAGLRNHRIWQTMISRDLLGRDRGIYIDIFTVPVLARLGFIAQSARVRVGQERGFLFFTGPRDRSESRAIPREKCRRLSRFFGSIVTYGHAPPLWFEKFSP